MSETDAPEGRYVTHGEFVRFEQSITRWQDGVRSEALAFQNEVRSSLRDLSSEVRKAADKPTNWGWVMAGISALAAICALVGSIAAYALVSRMDANEKRIDSNVATTGTLAGHVSGIRESRWSRDDQDDHERDVGSELDRRIGAVIESVEQLEDRIHEHQRDGHPGTVLREIENLRAIAERADKRSERTALQVAVLRGTSEP